MPAVGSRARVWASWSLVVCVASAIIWLILFRAAERLPEEAPSALSPIDLNTTSIVGQGEVVTRAELASRLRLTVAEPSVVLRYELQEEAIRLMDLHVAGSFDEYSRYRELAGLPKLPDEPFRHTHQAAAEELGRLTFHWDRSEFLLLRDGKTAYFLVHEGIAAVEKTRAGGTFPDLIPVPLPVESYRVLCRVPVTFPEPTDGVMMGTYYIFMSNSTPSGKWVIFRLGITSSGTHSDAWRRYVSSVW